MAGNLPTILIIEAMVLHRLKIKERMAMTEERITKVQDPDGSTHTTTTIVHDDGSVRRESGGAGRWVLLILLLVAIGVVIWMFNGMSGAEINKDNAVADAASDVGNAAQQAGDAVQDVANDVTNPE